MKQIYYISGWLAVLLLLGLSVQAQMPVNYGSTTNVNDTFSTYYACLGANTDNGRIRFKSTSSSLGGLSLVWKRNGVIIPTGATFNTATITYSNSNNYRMTITSSTNAVTQDYEGIYELEDSALGITYAFFYLDVVPLPSINLPTGTYCSGDDLTVNVTGSNGPPLTYNWARGATPVGGNSPTITITSSATYNITVTDSLGCAATTARAVNLGTAPTVAVTSGGNLDQINSQSGPIDLSNLSSLLSVSSPTGCVNPTLSGPGIVGNTFYPSSVTSLGHEVTLNYDCPGSNCGLTTPFNVYVYSLTFDKPSYCAGDEVELTINDMSFEPTQVHLNGTAVSSPSPVINMSGSASTGYSGSIKFTLPSSLTGAVTLTLSNSTVSAVEQITIFPQPNATGLTATSNGSNTLTSGSVFCPGDDIQFSVNPIASSIYSWTVNGNLTNSQNPQLDIIDASNDINLSLSIQDDKGCVTSPSNYNLTLSTNTTAPTTVSAAILDTVTINSGPIVLNTAVTVTGNDCNSGGTFSGLGVSGGIFYPSVAANAGNKISVTYSCSNIDGCTLSSSFDISIDGVAIKPQQNSYCLGAMAIFDVEGLGFAPDSVAIPLKGGGQIIGTVDTTGLTLNATTNQYSGTLSFTVPNYAISGVFTFRDATTTDTEVAAVGIENPNLGLNLASFYCSNSSAITLSGTPSAGVASYSIFPDSAIVLPSGLLTGTTFTPANMDTFPSGTYAEPYTGLSVMYSFTPSGCTVTAPYYPLRDTFDTEIRDVTVNSFDLSGSSPYAKSSGALDLTTAVSPAWVVASPGGGSDTLQGFFAGPGVLGNVFQVSTVSSDSVYTLSFTRTNGGCSNTDNSVIEVVDGALLGLNSSYCQQALADTLTRDPNTPSTPRPGYWYFEESFYQLGRDTVVFTPPSQPVSQNVAVGSCFFDPNYIVRGAMFINEYSNFFKVRGLGIVPTDTTPGAEEYLFDPSLVTFSGVDTVITITFEYFYRTYLDGSQVLVDYSSFFFPCEIYYPPNLLLDNILVSSQTVNVRVYRPAFASNTPDVFCGADTDTIGLSATPVGGTFSLFDATGNSVIQPNLLYGSKKGIKPNDFDVVGQDSSYLLTYDFSGVGAADCPIDSINIPITIIGSYQMDFTGRHSNHSDPAKVDVYCISETDDELIINRGRAGNTGGVLTGDGVVQSGGRFFFSPSQAGAGSHTLQFFYNDVNGCVTEVQKTFRVAERPSVAFSGDRSVCSNSGLRDLTADVKGNPYVLGTGIDTAFFALNGAPLPYGANYDPAAFGTGPQIIEVFYIDSSAVATGCDNSIRDTIQINGTPNLSITGLAPAYCSSDPNASLVGSPNTGGLGAFLGPRIVSGDEFNPDALSLTSPITIDTVRYTFEETSTGCRDTVIQAVEIRQTPTVSLSGLAPLYCSSDDPDISISPVINDAVGTQDSLRFTGIGASIVGGSLTFTPADLAASGLQSTSLSLEYVSTSGCRDSLNQTVALYTDPVVSISTVLDTSYCANDSDVLFEVSGASTNASSSNATVTGQGVATVPVLSQNTSNILTYNVTYIPYTVSSSADTVVFLFEDENGCKNTSSRIIDIRPLPTITLTGLNAYYCEGAGLDTLSGTPTTAGSFGSSNASVSNVLSTAGVLNPSNLSVGIKTLYYTGQGTNGCRDTLVQSFEIKALPTVSLVGLNPSYCANDGAVSLSGSPVGGVFSESGSNNAVDSLTGLFQPTVAGSSSNYIVEYTYTDNFGCVDSALQTTEIRAVPNPVSALTIQEYCSNATIQGLSGNPGTANLDTAFFYLASGGTGIASSGGGFSFNPSLAAAGVDTIVYEVRNTGGCTAYDPVAVFVVTAPDVSFTGLAPFYCKDASDGILTANIAGGTFSSNQPGLSGGIFSPAAAPVGNHYITYNYQKDTISALDNATVITCTDSYLDSTEVRALPTPSFTGLAANYCESDLSSITLTPTAGYAGGTFSSAEGGITGNLFLPNQAQTGINTILYSYTDASTTCTGITTQTTQVRRQPNSLTIANLTPRYCADATTVFDVQGDLINTPATTTVPAPGSSVSVTGYGLSGAPIFDGASGIFQSYNIGYDASLAAAQNVSQDTIIFIFTNEFGCKDTIQRQIVIDTLPDVSFQNLSTIYCRNDGLLTLTNTGIPSIFTGSGGNFTSLNNSSSIQNNVEYVLSSASLGIDTLIYDYEDDNGCQDTAQWAFEVVDPPVVSFNFVDTMGNIVDTVCLSSGAIRLVPNLPGGTFSGSGVVDDTTFTTNIGQGTYLITYAYTDILTGCSNSFVDSIVVAPRPDVRFTGLGSNAYCQDSVNIVLVDSSSFGTGYGPPDFFNTYFEQVLPNGNSVITLGDSLFLNPITMNTGLHIIRRIVEDSLSGCASQVSEAVVINPLPDNLEILGVDSTHCRNDVITAEGRPIQGANSTGRLVLFWNTMAAPIPVDTTFGNITSLSPAVDTLPNGQALPTGSYTYEYAFNDANGCENRVLDTFAIHPNPVANFVANPVCEGDSIALFSVSSVLDAIAASDSIVTLDWQYMNNITASDSLVWIATSSEDVGSHDVNLEVITGIGCSDTYTEAAGLEIYAKPDISFIGTNQCEGDSSRFLSDTTWIDYLSSLDSSYSSIFQMSWNFGDGNSSSLTGPILDYNASHVYSAAGAYEVQLSVEIGDGIFGCSSTDSLSFIISPSVNSYPYYQKFDTPGDWFAESSDPTQANYWNWGLAQGSVIQTTAADTFNTVWKTDATVSAPTDAWVYGACFDLDSLTRPMIAFDYWSQTEEGLDGTVVEYFDVNTNKWLPLGDVQRGVNWFNTNIIAGSPGDQVLAPKGWSGKDADWKNARYRLDAYQGLSRLRLRFAFGTSGSVSTSSDGFAFDNIWVGDRQRNVLLETFSNKNFPNMANINSRLYNLLYRPDLVRDVTLLQYHGKEPNPSDEFHQDNPGDVSSRELFYKVDDAAESFKDGISVGTLLTNITNISNAQFDAQFDANMLMDPDFQLKLNRAEVTGNTVTVNLGVEALRDLGQDDYVIHIAILEDSLTYPGGNARVQAVMRKLLPEAGGALRSRSWAAGDADSILTQWTLLNNSYNPNNFVVVAFIQSSSTEEVFQSVTNRDISGFLGPVGTVTEEDREIAQEGLFTAKVFPNPAQDGFRVAFEQGLNETCNWELFDLNGQLLQSGVTAPQTEQFYIQREQISAGMYVLRLRVGNAYTQRRIIFVVP